MGEATIVSKHRAVTVMDGVELEADGKTDKVKVVTTGFRTLRLRRVATGDVKVTVYGPTVDGEIGESIAAIDSGKDDYPEAIDIRGFPAVWIEAEDATSSANEVTIEAFLGT